MGASPYSSGDSLTSRPRSWDRSSNPLTQHGSNDARTSNIEPLNVEISTLMEAICKPVDIPPRDSPDVPPSSSDSSLWSHILPHRSFSQTRSSHIADNLPRVFPCSARHAPCYVSTPYPFPAPMFNMDATPTLVRVIFSPQTPF